MAHRVYVAPPRDFLLTKDWLMERYGAAEVSRYFRIIHEEVFYQPRRPKGTVDPQFASEDFPNRPPWRWYFNSIGSPGAFAALIEGGRVYGKQGAVVTPDHRLLADVSHEWIASPAEHSIFKQTLLPPVVRTPESVAVLDTVGGENYFHWMADLLPRLELARQSGWPIDKFIIRDDGKPFQQETLRLLGIPEERIMKSHDAMHVQAERLVVPARPCEAKWAFEFLRQAFLPRALAENATADRRALPKRIYISRERAAHRNLCNENEVLQVLQKHGFHSVCLEELSVLDQVALFAQAESVVSLHGAGLTNLAFCQPGTKVVEMFSPRFFNPCFWTLCQHVDVDYYFLIGTRGERPASYQNSDWYFPGLDNVWIDVNRLAELVEALEEHKRK